MLTATQWVSGWLGSGSGLHGHRWFWLPTNTVWAQPLQMHPRSWNWGGQKGPLLRCSQKAVEPQVNTQVQSCSSLKWPWVLCTDFPTGHLVLISLRPCTPPASWPSGITSGLSQNLPSPVGFHFLLFAQLKWLHAYQAPFIWPWGVQSKMLWPRPVGVSLQQGRPTIKSQHFIIFPRLNNNEWKCKNNYRGPGSALCVLAG